MFERGDELGRRRLTAAELAQFFPTPNSSQVGDEIADGSGSCEETSRGRSRCSMPCATDYSLRRLVHYTGSDWRAVQPWILLTNYHRYVDQFVRWATRELPTRKPVRSVDSARRRHDQRGMANRPTPNSSARQWHRFQMPAYHLLVATATA